MTEDGFLTFDLADLDDDFLEDLQAVLLLPDRALQDLLKRLPSLLSADAEDRGEAYRVIRRSAGASFADVARAARCAVVLFNEAAEGAQPSVETWAATLENQLPRGEGSWYNAEKFRQFASTVIHFATSEEGQATSSARARSRAAVGVLPSFVGVATTVDLRGVFGSARSEPRMLEITPVVSVNIAVNRGAVEEFFFQMDLAELQYFRDQLDDTLKEAEALVRQVRFIRTDGEG